MIGTLANGDIPAIAYTIAAPAPTRIKLAILHALFCLGPHPPIIPADRYFSRLFQCNESCCDNNGNVALQRQVERLDFNNIF
eukprot:765791-Hanusia_phi.AAC.6